MASKNVFISRKMIKTQFRTNKDSIFFFKCQLFFKKKNNNKLLVEERESFKLEIKSKIGDTLSPCWVYVVAVSHLLSHWF